MIIAIIISYLLIAVLAIIIFLQKAGFILLDSKIELLESEIEDAREDIYELQDEAQDEQEETSIWRTKDSHKN